MRNWTNLVLILALVLSFFSLVLAQTSGNVVKLASLEKSKEELKEELKTKLEEQVNELTTQTQRLEKEKKELNASNGFRVIVSPINDSGKIMKLTIEERMVGKEIERKVRYISKDNKEIEFNSSLRLFDYVGQGNTSRLRAQLSDGSEEDIKILPEHALEIAYSEIKGEDLKLNIQETTHNNIPKVVYNVEANKEGKFLGIFKTSLKISLDIDSKSGEILSKNKPWWSFLVSGEED